MHSKCDNKEIKINGKANQVVEKLFRSLLNRYQNNLETSMKCSDFTFDCVHLLYYKCNKINPNHDESYIDSPDRIKYKKATINPTDKRYNKWFQYTITVALSHKEIGKNLEIIRKIKLFISKYN